MQLVDTHCHLDLLDLSRHDNNLEKALAFAETQAVQNFLCVSVDLKNFPNILNLVEKFPNVLGSVGLHPNEVVEQEPSLEEIIRLGSHPKIVAVGETGLDYYRSEGDLEWQRDRFRLHIAAAKALQKPLIIHTRQAREDTIKVMREEKVSEVRGVMHCFTENWDFAKQAMDLDFYISFSGIVTFKNALEIQEVAKKIPLDRMLIETDSPYLAPNPHRGKPNEPAYVRLVAEYIAELRGIPLEELAMQTTKNFFQLIKRDYHV